MNHNEFSEKNTKVFLERQKNLTEQSNYISKYKKYENTLETFDENEIKKYIIQYTKEYKKDNKSNLNQLIKDLSYIMRERNFQIWLFFKVKNVIYFKLVTTVTKILDSKNISNIIPYIFEGTYEEVKKYKENIKIKYKT